MQRHKFREKITVRVSASVVLLGLMGACNSICRCCKAPAPTLVEPVLAAPRPLKVVKSALAVVPPVEVWDGLQRIRQAHDKGYFRWMPHINLLYPFWEDVGDSFEDAGAMAETALRSVAPFKVPLTRLSYFEHGKKSATVWLDPQEQPEVAERWAALHAALLSAFPECTELSDDKERSITRFHPHMSVGNFAGKAKAEEAIGELSKTWAPVEFSVDRVCLISRKNYNDPFVVRYEVPLAGSRMQRGERNLRYAAVPAAADAATDGESSAATPDPWQAPNKKSEERPGLEFFKKMDMEGLPWGLFPGDAYAPL